MKNDWPRFGGEWRFGFGGRSGAMGFVPDKRYPAKYIRDNILPTDRDRELKIYTESTA